jgi:predicted DNA-binding transcriptional regulator AlpA
MRVHSFKELRPVFGIRYCRQHVRRLYQAGQFPKPIILNGRSVAWRAEDVEAWLNARPKAGEQAVA